MEKTSNVEGSQNNTDKMHVGFKTESQDPVPACILKCMCTPHTRHTNTYLTDVESTVGY